MKQNEHKDIKILIVDDEPDNLGVINEYLKETSYRCFVASNGNTAITRAMRIKPDMILLDVNMPGMNGFELCRLLKQNGIFRNIPIIFLTVLDDIESKKHAFGAGGVDYITKPVEKEELLARVETHLENYLYKNKLEQLVKRRTTELEQEIAQRKIIEQKLAHNAYHDPLTDLPNRAFLMNHLIDCLEKTQQDSSYRFAVMFLDLDQFKVVNDRFGHIVGDELLVIIAKRLQSCISDNGLVARLGGDEFVIVLDNTQDNESIALFAQNIQHEIALPIQLEEQELVITASIGIILSQQGDPNSWINQPTELLRDADTAMYQAKNKGRARYEFFNVAMRTHVIKRFQVEAELRTAIKRNQFKMVYQPIVSLKTGQLTRVEALLRWHHPQRGQISPLEFINLAEETGLIIPLGELILHNVCQDIKRWFTKISHPFRVAVNISVRQFQEQDLNVFLDEILPQIGISIRWLEFEITETIAMQNFSKKRELLTDLSQRGVRLSIDDFGTGHSSLSRLTQLPIDALKIDRLFIHHLNQSQQDAAVVSAMIAMAHNLGLKVIAEGVETVAQASFLRNHNCDEIQGYLINRAFPAEQLSERISASSARFPIDYGSMEHMEHDA